MKKLGNHFIFIFFLFSFLTGNFTLKAQSDTDYITVSGIVKDGRSKKKLENVNITIPGTTIGTVTNADGRFSIKVKDSLQAKFVEFSHVGYTNLQIPITQKDTSNLTVFLINNRNMLSEVTVHGDPYKLVEEAIGKIDANYSEKKELLTGFYRETVKKRRNYITITEAVVSIYKTPYSEDIDQDRVQVLKGRKLLSPKPGDTLAVKLLGGPNLAIMADFVKNRDILLDIKSLNDYKFEMKDPVMIDDSPHYVIRFEPQISLPFPLFEGKLYIEKQSLSISRAEFNYDMKDLTKVTSAILKKKPRNLRFKPEEVSFLTTYKQRDGKTYLHYVRNEIRFKCDWKRRLFSTSYTIDSKIVITDEREQPDVSSIPYKQSFRQNQALSDKVSDFQDENFWMDYNIIEPTESLESAVNKLKKQK